MLTTDQLIGSGLAILSAFMHAADGVMGTVQRSLVSDFILILELDFRLISKNLLIFEKV